MIISKLTALFVALASGALYVDHANLLPPKYSPFLKAGAACCTAIAGLLPAMLAKPSAEGAK